jgi:sec-independent protein translocase protein TatA
MGLDNPIHLILLLVVLLLVFGAKRLPEMGRSLGDGLRGFKDAIGGETAVHTLHGTAPAAAASEAPAAQNADSVDRSAVA